MDLRERTAWRAFTANPCGDTAMEWAIVHSRIIGTPDDLPLTEVKGLGNRAINLLEQVGITTWEQLCGIYKEQLAALAGIGPAHRNKVIGVIEANGIKLAKKPETQEERAALLDSIPADKYRQYDYSFISGLHHQLGRPFTENYWRARPW